MAEQVAVVRVSQVRLQRLLSALPNLIGPRHVVVIHFRGNGALVQLMAHVERAGFLNLALVVADVISYQIQIYAVRPGGVAAAVII